MSKTDSTNPNSSSRRGWDVFAARPDVRSFLVNPPVWFSALIQVAILLLFVSMLIWMMISFLKGTALLTVFATSGGDKEQAEAARHLATVGGTFLGGLVATILVVWRTILTHRQTKVGEDQRRLSEQIHFTTLFTKAVEQLGATREVKDKDSAKDIVKTLPNIPVRIGAIYALGRIGKESITDNIPILDILSSYIRENSHLIPDNDTIDIRDDIVAAFNVICLINAIFREERIDKDHFINLKNCDLPNSIIHHKKLININFTKSNLKNSDNRYSYFYNCTFNESVLDDSIFSECELQYCRYPKSKILKLKMDSSNVKNCVFADSDLSGSHILNTKFTACCFDAAIMKKTYLKIELNECTYEKMILCDENYLNIFNFSNWSPPDLTKCEGLTQENIDTIISCELTILPDHFKKPSHWHTVRVIDELGQWHILTSGTRRISSPPPAH